MQTRFHYAQTSFRTHIVSAAGLTLIISCLSYLFLRLAVVSNALWVSAATALIFFAFCSLAMIVRYLRGAVILAVRPDGLYDARHSHQAWLWSDILRLELHRTENEFQLIVTIWEPKGKMRNKSLDLAPLDADVNTILQAISAYKPVEVQTL